jgi:uncharacterized YceG family protein
MTEDNDDLDFGWVDVSDAETATPAAPEQPPPQQRPGKRPPRGGGERPPHGGGRTPRRRIWIRRGIAIALLAVVVFAVWFAVELFQPFTGAGTGSVTVVVARGESAGQIGQRLAKSGIIASSFFFNLRASLDGDRSKLRAGIFQLRHGMSYAAALAALTSPPGTVEIDVTIPPGYTRTQIAATARGDGLTGKYLAASTPAAAGFDITRYGAASSVHTLEGFLFPDTFFDYPHANVRDLISQQLEDFRTNFDTLDLAKARAAKLTPYDVVIIASMIEREAQVPSDRPLVAAVIYNRLKQKVPLGIDATLRYALNDFTKPLTATQLALNSPYNTRLHQGLPPTPISNPGLASLAAAADPAAVSYLYYVDKPNTCGELAFATTFSQFQADVNAYNAARNANGGRAPTKCP